MSKKEALLEQMFLSRAAVREFLFELLSFGRKTGGWQMPLPDGYTVSGVIAILRKALFEALSDSHFEHYMNLSPECLDKVNQDGSVDRLIGNIIKVTTLASDIRKSFYNHFQNVN